MRVLRNTFFYISLLAVALQVQAQEETVRGTTIGLIGGPLSYQGDLQPNSFSFQQSRFYAGIYVRQPLFNRFSLKAGLNSGSLHADDKNNRDYLKIRNLNFSTKLTEGFLVLDYELLSLEQRRFTPFGYGGLSYFHFNPYTFDSSGEKFYLQPLGTEGQGLSRYPDRSPYKLSQMAIAFGGGIRFKLSDAVLINLEIGERKTFTDYLDDVSKNYADRDALLAGHGPKAVELAFRGDELPGGGTYPKEGEQRGTPSEMDWYYMAGLSVEINLSAFTHNHSGITHTKHGISSMRCPKVW